MDPFLSTIIGGGIAIAGGAGTQWVMHHLTVTHRRRTLAYALSGEIASICAIAHKRKYLENMKDMKKAIEQDQPTYPFKVSITQNYFTIFNENAKDIGLLPPECAEHTARFYVQTKSLIEDFTNPPESPNEAIVLLEMDIKLLEDTLKLGDSLKQELQRIR
mgnify:CR=1 FL=1